MISALCDDPCEDKWISQRANEKWRDPVYRGRQRDAAYRSEVRKAHSEAKMQEKNPNWKGTSQEEAKAIKASRDGQNQSKRVMDRDKNTCQGCGIIEVT
ncbi:MAG: hypothetical protein ACXAEF_11565 [Candidatus Thorarchaeota archaeon]